MKTKIVYLMLIVTMLLSACSGGAHGLLIKLTGALALSQKTGEGERATTPPSSPVIGRREAGGWEEGEGTAGAAGQAVTIFMSKPWILGRPAKTVMLSIRIGS